MKNNVELINGYPIDMVLEVVEAIRNSDEMNLEYYDKLFHLAEMDEEYYSIKERDEQALKNLVNKAAEKLGFEKF